MSLILSKSLRSINTNTCATAIWEIARSAITNKPYFEHLEELLFLLFDERWEIRAKARMCVYVLVESAIKKNFEIGIDKELYEICSYGHQYDKTSAADEIIKELSTQIDRDGNAGYAATYAFSRLRSEKTLTILEEVLHSNPSPFCKLKRTYLLSQFILPSELLTYYFEVRGPRSFDVLSESNRIWPKEFENLRGKSLQEFEQNTIDASKVQKFREEIRYDLSTLVETELIDYLGDWNKRALLAQMIDCLSKHGASPNEWQAIFKLEFALSDHSTELRNLLNSMTSEFYDIDGSNGTDKVSLLSFGIAALSSRMNTNFSTDKINSMGNFYRAIELYFEEDAEDIKIGLFQVRNLAPTATTRDDKLVRGLAGEPDPLSDHSGSFISHDKMFNTLLGRDFSSEAIKGIKRIIKEESNSLKTQAFKAIKLFKLDECKEVLIEFLNSELEKEAAQISPEGDLTEKSLKELLVQAALKAALKALSETSVSKDLSRVEAMAALNRLSGDGRKEVIIRCLALPKSAEKIIALRIISMNSWAKDCIDTLVDSFLLSKNSEYINHATEALKKITDSQTLSEKLGKKLEDIPVEKWNEEALERGTELQEHILSRTGGRVRLSFVTN